MLLGPPIGRVIRKRKDVDSADIGLGALFGDVVEVAADQDVVNTIAVDVSSRRQGLAELVACRLAIEDELGVGLCILFGAGIVDAPAKR